LLHHPEIEQLTEMSETFGLTGVDVDPLAKPKPVEQQ